MQHLTWWQRHHLPQFSIDALAAPNVGPAGRRRGAPHQFSHTYVFEN
jgi:hypothetical protein